MRIILIASLTALLAAATAAGPLDELHVGGFVSQGYLNTSHNNYLVRDSRDGTAEFHEAAFNMQTFVEPRLRVGIQFFARDFGSQGNNNVMVDWAYADYAWQDYLGIRFGKFKTAQGLYGQGRDVDMLRPTILLPQSVYNEAHRDFILGVEGLGIHGNIPLGEAGGVDYEIYGGTLNVPDVNDGFWQDTFREVGITEAQSLTGPLPEDVSIDFLGVIEPRVHFDYLYGGGLFWNCPVSGVRLGISSLAARFDMQSRMQFLVHDPAAADPTEYVDVPMTFQGDLSRAMVLSGEWVGDRVTLTSEYYQERVNDVTSEGYYVQGSLQMTTEAQITTYFSRFLRDREDGSGDRYVAAGYPDYVGWQNDYCLALRVDPMERLVLKFEYHSIDGMGLLSLAHNDIDDDDAYKRWWSFIAAKATVHF